MTLYRIAYAWPDGRRSHATLAAQPSQVLQRASDFVRCLVGGELLSITEQRPVVVQHTLELTP